MKTRITHFAAPAERRNGRRGRLLGNADLLPAEPMQFDTTNRNDFSSPVVESSAADRPRAPAALGERESVNGYLQRLCLQRSQLLRSVRSGGVPARKGQAACRLVALLGAGQTTTHPPATKSLVCPFPDPVPGKKSCKSQFLTTDFANVC